MRFSDYTLGGLMFLGGGVEIKPKNIPIYASAMYGRFSEAIQPIIGAGLGAFQRIGFAAKVVAGTETDQIGLILFRAKDDLSSIALDETLEDIPPKENLVWSIVVKRKLGKLSLAMEYATSALTRDTRNEEFVLNDFSYYNNLGTLFTPNATTIYRNAINASASLALTGYSLNFAFKQVDPDFESLGATSINNDQRDITAGIGWQMFSGKVSIATNGGLQRNNLDESQELGVKKLIGSVAVNWAASTQLNVNASFSNFNSTAVRSAQLLSDTLEFFQTTRNVNTGVSYQFESALPQSINLAGSYQEAFDSEGNQNDAINGVLSHTIMLTTYKLSISTSINYNLIIANGLGISNYGPTIALSKPINDKMQTSAAFSRLSSQLDGELQNIITNLNLSYKWKIYKTHSFGMNFLMLNRGSQVEGVPSVSERRVSVKYGYTF